MNILKGTVTSARATTAISGGGNNSAVQTTHILLFKVDSRQAKISSASPAMMSDNDAVVLAGTEKNETTGVVGDVGKLGPVIGMIVGFGVALVAFIVFGAPALGFIPKLVGLIFLVVGIFSVARFSKIKAAVDLLSTVPK